MKASYDPALANRDLLPTPPEQRTWNKWHIAALWVGMAVCIPTYQLASGMIDKGASLGIAILSIAIGSVVVLVPLILNGHPGTKYGLPFPVLIRSSFGVLGAHVPSLIRALVACGWFGIQTWIGGKAIHLLLVSVAPDFAMPDILPGFLGITGGELVCFLVFWLFNVVIILSGMDALKWFEVWAAPFLLVVGIALLIWAAVGADSFTAILINPSRMPTSRALAIGITGSVAFWGTLALNIPDFTRMARSQRDQAIGQAIALPATMTLYSFIGAAVTNATLFMYGKRIADPVDLLSRVGGFWLVLLAMIGVAIATLSTNLAANVVSPANGFAALWPKHIGFRRGALITSVVGILICPWKLWQDPQAYVITWLIGCGGLLGAVGGIMIADYFLIRRTELVVDDLYRRGGRYEYLGGINPVAIIALVLSVLPLLPGFLASLGQASPPELLTKLYEWSWFVSFFLAGALYYAGMKWFGKDGSNRGD